MSDDAPLLLKKAHVIDIEQGIDRVTNIVIAGGKIASIGDDLPEIANSLDLSGRYVTPGWIDAHVHTYGSLGFSDVDSIGVCQGSTTVVDAGDCGLATIDEFSATMRGYITDIYPAPHINPLGIVGHDGTRAIRSVDVEEWEAWIKKNPGYLRYLKVSAYSLETPGPLYLAKGMAEILRLPLYQHIGEMTPQQLTPRMVENAFNIAQAGDIITHIYHANPGQVIDEQGKLLPCVRDAARRGVLFDISFGGQNFSWRVAETCMRQDLLPHIISSDLQQFNVVYPARSLANVMSIFLHLGLSLSDVIEKVTSMSAKALDLADRTGSLRPGRMADITVFRLEDGEFELADCYKVTRTANRRLVPELVFKAGKRVDCDFERGQAESNWFMQLSEDSVPAAAGRITGAQKEFLRALRSALSRHQWTGLTDAILNSNDVFVLQDIFHEVRKDHALALREALQAVFDCFLEHPFAVQIGVLLARMNRQFVLDRLATVAGSVEYARA
ncbi:MAG TPA: amidohydrolase family protein [Stellaceae bacterium]|nr:amidohydrolase family protein [Stellaceae bacterium]